MADIIALCKKKGFGGDDAIDCFREMNFMRNIVIHLNGDGPNYSVKDIQEKINPTIGYLNKMEDERRFC